MSISLPFAMFRVSRNELLFSAAFFGIATLSAFFLFKIFFPGDPNAGAQSVILGAVAPLLLDITFLLSAIIIRSTRVFAVFSLLALSVFVVFFGRTIFFAASMLAVWIGLILFFRGTRGEINARIRFEVFPIVRTHHSFLLTVLAFLIVFSYAASPRFPIKYEEISIPSTIFDTALNAVEGQIKKTFPFDFYSPIENLQMPFLQSELKGAFGVSVSSHDSLRDVLYRFVNAKANEFLKNATTFDGKDVFPIAFFVGAFFVLRGTFVIIGMVTPLLVYILVKILLFAHMLDVQKTPVEKETLTLS